MRSSFNDPQSPSNSASESTIAEVRGTLERVTFHNEENSYTVARLLPEGAHDVVTFTGVFNHPIIGEFYVLRGLWKRHPQFGMQLEVSSYESVRPATAEAIEKYLGSGMVKGLGPANAKRIVEKFGDQALNVIDQSPDQLLKVQGIGRKLLGVIKETWSQQSDVRGVMVFLQGHGVSPAYAAKIYKVYQGRSIEMVESNPYRLASEIWGIGFKMADRIARNLGYAEDDQRRLEAGLVYVLTQATESGGSTYMPEEILAATAKRELGDYDLSTALRALISSNRLIRERAVIDGASETALYLPALYDAERTLASGLLLLMDRGGAQRPGVLVSEPPGSSDQILSDEQNQAVELAQQSKVLAITGGPGVGKTTTTKAIVNRLQASGLRVLLTAPTGRAAKRLSEVTGREAVTVHRLLAYDPQKRGFQRNPENPLECDVLLIDESSMLDTQLACAVVLALPSSAKLILVGDVDQLPSVSAGNVLRDIIDSGVIPVARLTKVFRQASKSMIISGAHTINSGNMPVMGSPRDTDADFIFISAEEGEAVTDKIVAIVANSLPKRGYSLSDVQVLSPMQRGSAGSAEINNRLQQALNPPWETKPEIKRGAKIFRLGDRVIQLRNNYDKQIYNGDIGVIVAVHPRENTLRALFDTREARYEQSDLDELGLAYSLSIHKSQGSEFPVVVIALHTQHFTMLQRNLIYTALTRARKLAVLVGSKRALGMAVGSTKQSDRLTRLKERLRRSI